MRARNLIVAAVFGAALAGCSSPDDEGGATTATPADKLNRPLPEETAGGPPVTSQSSGALPARR